MSGQRREKGSRTLPAARRSLRPKQAPASERHGSSQAAARYLPSVFVEPQPFLPVLSPEALAAVPTVYESSKQIASYTAVTEQLLLAGVFGPQAWSRWNETAACDFIETQMVEFVRRRVPDFVQSNFDFSVLLGPSVLGETYRDLPEDPLVWYLTGAFERPLHVQIKSFIADCQQISEPFLVTALHYLVTSLSAVLPVFSWCDPLCRSDMFHYHGARAVGDRSQRMDTLPADWRNDDNYAFDVWVPPEALYPIMRTPGMGMSRFRQQVEKLPANSRLAQILELCRWCRAPRRILPMPLTDQLRAEQMDDTEGPIAAVILSVENHDEILGAWDYQWQAYMDSSVEPYLVCPIHLHEPKTITTAFSVLDKQLRVLEGVRELLILLDSEVEA